MFMMSKTKLPMPTRALATARSNHKRGKGISIVCSKKLQGVNKIQASSKSLTQMPSSMQPQCSRGQSCLTGHMGTISTHMGWINPHMSSISTHMGRFSTHMGRISAYMGRISAHMGRISTPRTNRHKIGKAQRTTNKRETSGLQLVCKSLPEKT